MEDQGQNQDGEVVEPYTAVTYYWQKDGIPYKRHVRREEVTYHQIVADEINNFLYDMSPHEIHMVAVTNYKRYQLAEVYLNMGQGGVLKHYLFYN